MEPILSIAVFIVCVLTIGLIYIYSNVNDTTSKFIAVSTIISTLIMLLSLTYISVKLPIY